MQKGYNSDLLVRGQRFHVQTEDWGQQNPFVVSQIFQNGAVVKTIKTSYEEALNQGPTQNVDAIKMAMQRQHTTVIDTLMAGKAI